MPLPAPSARRFSPSGSFLGLVRQAVSNQAREGFWTRTRAWSAHERVEGQAYVLKPLANRLPLVADPSVREKIPTQAEQWVFCHALREFDNNGLDVQGIFNNEIVQRCCSVFFGIHLDGVAATAPSNLFDMQIGIVALGCRTVELDWWYVGTHSGCREQNHKFIAPQLFHLRKFSLETPNAQPLLAKISAIRAAFGCCSQRILDDKWAASLAARLVVIAVSVVCNVGGG